MQKHARIIVSLILLLGAVVFFLARMSSTRVPEQDDGEIAALANSNQIAKPEPPTPEEKKVIRDRVLAQLNLTADQQEQIQDINERFDEQEEGMIPYARMLAIAQVLDAEQLAIARREVRAEIDREVEERTQVLPPQEQEKFREKFDQRRAAMRALFFQELPTGSQTQ